MTNCTDILMWSSIMTAQQMAALQPALGALIGQFRPYFNRQATFNHFRPYLLGLMANLKRKSIEPITVPPNAACGFAIAGS